MVATANLAAVALRSFEQALPTFKDRFFALAKERDLSWEMKDWKWRHDVIRNGESLAQPYVASLTGDSETSAEFPAYTGSVVQKVEMKFVFAGDRWQLDKVKLSQWLKTVNNDREMATKPFYEVRSERIIVDAAEAAAKMTLSR